MDRSELKDRSLFPAFQKTRLENIIERENDFFT